MIDLHIHLLPGIDDGCADVDATLAMARVAAADGITAVAATPHVSEAYPTTSEAMLAALCVAQDAIARAGIPLEVRAGAEIAIDRIETLSDSDLRAFSLGGGAKYLLLECPFSVWPAAIELHSGRLAQLGMRTILAHPERSAGVQSNGGVETLRAAVDRGLLVQINAGSLTGSLGKPSAITARALLEAGLVHIVASDAHDTDRRPPLLTPAAAAIGDSELARWLTADAPAAVIAGDALPQRPAGQPKKRKSSRLAMFRRGRDKA